MQLCLSWLPKEDASTKAQQNSPDIPKTHPPNGVATSSPEGQEESKLEEEFKSGSPLPGKEKVLGVGGSSEDASLFLS